MLSYSKPTPSQKYLQENYEYNPTNKTLPLKRRFDAPRGWTKAGHRPGSINVQEHRSNYNQTIFTLRNKEITGGKLEQYIMSRIIWKYHYGVEPKGVIDHINGDSTDNRIENLQDITQQQNLNKKPGEVINAA